MRSLQMNGTAKLDLGCGNNKKDGFTGVDCLPLPGVDIVHDLNRFPYPFPDDSIAEVWMDQVLEHLGEPVRAMEEVYRISRAGARVTVGVPYFRSLYAVIDPTHRNFFTSQWFHYFDPTHPFHAQYQYTPAKFRVDRIEFDREFKTGRTGLLHRLLISLAEKRPELYEARLSHVLPLSSVTFYLSVLK